MFLPHLSGNIRYHIWKILSFLADGQRLRDPTLHHAGSASHGCTLLEVEDVQRHTIFCRLSGTRGVSREAASPI